MKHFKIIFSLIIIIATMSSCSPVKEVFYFQDLNPDVAPQVVSRQPIKIRPGDKISIVVNSKDPHMGATFNFQQSMLQVSANTGSIDNPYGYTVDKNGEINFPALGHIHIGGMTKEELTAYIETELINRELLKDPIVIAEFKNFYISVMGEVSKPGRYNIKNDNITLLEGLSMASDLTIYGNRSKIMVLREEGDKQVAYYVDLRSAKQLYSSPVYYLKQNDIIYVEPNSMRASQSTVNGNTFKSAPFWLSLASFLLTITVLFVK